MEGENEQESVTQKLQNKADRLKLLSMTANAHNLSQPLKQQDNQNNDVALVAALSVSPRIAELFLEIRGLEYDYKNKKLIQVTRPIMNIEGAYRFCKLLKRLAEEIEWASYSEEEIPSRIIHYFEENISYFTFYGEQIQVSITIKSEAEELFLDEYGNIKFIYDDDEYEILDGYDSYGLKPSDFNYIITVLQNFIDTSFHKSKQGKYINTLGRTYSEDTLRRALDTDGNKNRGKSGEGGFLNRYNPFKENK